MGLLPRPLRPRIYAGDSMVGRGRVTGKRREESRFLVDLEITVFNQRGVTCCPAEVTLELVMPK